MSMTNLDSFCDFTMQTQFDNIHQFEAGDRCCTCGILNTLTQQVI
jgi:hypothetical protein